MQKKTTTHRLLACVLLLSFMTMLMPVSAWAERVPADGTRETIDLYDVSAAAVNAEQDSDILLAQSAVDRQPGAVQQSDSQGGCGDFWQVHFGGYRWVWWALAGAALVAIHAD